MLSSLFVTGGSGFIGGHLLRALNKLGFKEIYSLHRNTQSLSKLAGVEYIRGDILNSETYGSRLLKIDTVVHLAAATGKVSKKEYFNVNTRGTECLVNECKRAGVKNFLFVSTIAVKYRNKFRYYYAQSKEQAEDIVRKSGLDYCIVRPTIVLGNGSPGWQNLKKLATAPVPFVFGKGQVKIQPVLVNDVIDCLINIIQKDSFENNEFEIGGAEKISMDDFLQRIHAKYLGKNANIRHLPLKPILGILTVLETIAYPLLPVNVGQFSSFNNDSTVDDKACPKNAAEMSNIDTMLEALKNNDNV